MRRGSRFGRRPLKQAGGYEHKLSSTTLAVLPSGVTIDKAGINYGQGAYKFYRGTAPITKVLPSSGGTSLSAGTIQITTGLTNITNFQMTMESAATEIATAGYRYETLNYTKGYINDGGVTVWVSATTVTGVWITATPAFGSRSGCTIHWLAIGT